MGLLEDIQAANVALLRQQSRIEDKLDSIIKELEVLNDRLKEKEE